jgi:hypothetical protein
MIIGHQRLHPARAAPAPEMTDNRSPLFEIPRVLVRFHHVAFFIVNANDSVIRSAAMLGVSDCVADCVRFAIPQATERQRIGDEIDAARTLGVIDS